MPDPSLADHGIPRGCSSMLKALRAYERGESGRQSKTQRAIVSAREKHRSNSSYGRRVKRAGQKALTRSEKMVAAAKRFRMLNPDRHKESVMRWEQKNPDKRSLIMKRYYVKNRARIIARVIAARAVRRSSL